jgi:hypothetical protein
MRFGSYSRDICRPVSIGDAPEIVECNESEALRWRGKKSAMYVTVELRQSNITARDGFLPEFNYLVYSRRGIPVNGC